MDYIAVPKSRKEIRELSKFVRKIQNAENILYFNIMGFLEHTLPRIFPNFTLSIGTIAEMGDFHGLTYPDRNEIKLRVDVYQGAHDGSGRDRLTAAHELYHFLVHSKNSVALARTGSKSIPCYMDPEWQADAFGGELLVPYDKAMNLTIPQIITACGVSEKAARYQFRKMHSM